MAAFSSIYVICSLYINSFFFSWGVQKITREAQPETQLHLTNDKQLIVKCSIGLVFFRFLWSRPMPVTEYFNDAVVSSPQTDASKVVFSKQLIVYCCRQNFKFIFSRKIVAHVNNIQARIYQSDKPTCVYLSTSVEY